jgi:hypothetical protein
VAVNKAGRIAIGAAVAIVLLLALAQLLLPRIAAGIVSSRVGRYGRVLSVSVSASPAIELLWRDADSVTVKAGALSLSPQQAAKLVWEGRGADRISFSARSARLGPLRLTDVSMQKRGSVLSAQGSASAADVRAALPQGLSVALVRSEGAGVVVRASGGLFGVGASVTALARPKEGKLVVRPQGSLFGALQLTLFADPHVYVQGIAASAELSSPGARSYRLHLAARLR